MSMDWLSVVWAVFALAVFSIIFSKLFRRNATDSNTASTLRARSRLTAYQNFKQQTAPDDVTEELTPNVQSVSSKANTSDNVKKKQSCAVTHSQQQNTSDATTDVSSNQITEFHCYVSYSPPSHQHPCFDSQTGLPVTRPLTSLDELLAWRPHGDSFSVPILALRDRVPIVTSHPQLIVCHDMMGGYTADKFVQGCPRWTNAAHMNGVPVMGTFITEWEDGAATCQQILESDLMYRQVADQLVSIAVYHKLDGWLVNIENKIQSGHVARLRDFVSYLTDRMHSCVKHSRVIWYDSVINTGELKWQNELNKLNYLFFTACDGIFLNYTWSDLTLANSSQRAGTRRYDVFVGIDVFGRGCPGGGGFNSKEALMKIKSYDLSAALFAPGWVFETQDKQKFSRLQDRFFELLQPHCQQTYCLTELPLSTNFCRGVGHKLFITGKEVLSSPWMNLSACDAQPTWTNDCYIIGNKAKLVLHQAAMSTDEAYDGSHCLYVNGSIKSDKSTRLIVRLFKCHISVKSPLLISYTFMSLPLDLTDVSLVLHIDKPPTYLVLTSSLASQPAESVDDELNEKLLSRFGVRRSVSVDASRFRMGMGPLYYNAFSPLRGEDEDRLRKLEGDINQGTNWITRYYVLASKHLQSYQIKEIRLICLPGAKADDTSKEFDCKLGHIRLTGIASLKSPFVTITNLCCSDIVWHRGETEENDLSVSLSLLWDVTAHLNVRQFDIWITTSSTEPIFIGRAFTNCFRVSYLPVESYKCVVFTVQSVSMSQFKQPLEQCPSLKLTWTV